MADQIIIEYGAKIDKLDAELRRLEGKLLSVEKTGKKSGNSLGDSFKKQGGIINELKGKIDDLTKARDRSHNPHMIKRYNQLIDESNNRLKQLTTTTKNSGSIMTKAMKGVGAAIAGAFAVQQVIQWGNKIKDVTVEFQKFGAILKNSLGSQVAADLAMSELTDWVTKTPAQLDEAVGAYIKLVNQGFKPTMEEMTKLADVAASQGKSIDQLVEAVLDARSGEFERLKEFGIRSQKEGDKVIFTFKGVQTQVAFTDQAIQDYILSLGDLEGVQGTTAAVSETLGGKISNLEDNFASLFNTLGSANSGVMSGIVDLLSDAVKGIEIALMTQEQIDKMLKNRELQVATSSVLAHIEEDAKKMMKLGMEQSEADDLVLRSYLANILKRNQADKERYKFITENKRVATFAEEVELKKQLELDELLLAEIEARIKKIEDLEKQAIANKEKEEKEAAEKRKKELEAQYKLDIERLRNLQAERENIEKNKFIKSEINEKQLNDNLENINLEFLERRKAIEQKYGKDFAEIDGQILNVKVQNRKKEIEEAERLLKESLDTRLSALTSAANIESNLDKELILKKELSEEDAARREIVRNIEVLEQRKQILKEAGKDIIDIETEILNEKLKLYKLDEDAVRKSEDEKKKIREQILNETIGLVTDSLTAINDINLNNRKVEFDEQRALNQQQADEYLTRLQERNRQGKLSDEQLAKQREKVQKDLAKKEAQIKEQQFKAEQDAALGRIAISTAEGIAKAIAASPLTFGLPFSAFVAAQGVLQAIVVKSQKPPKFKDGVIDFKGKGSETSDSNLVYISNRESIIKAKQSKKHTEALKAINNDTFEKYIDKFHIMPALKKADKVKHTEKKRKSDMSENLYKAMMQNGLVDTSHLERLTKRNKSVRMENTDEIINGIGMHLKGKRGLQNKFGVKR